MYVDDGEKFKVTDYWLEPSNAHRPLRGTWTASTSFVELPDYIEETLVRRGVSSMGVLRQVCPPIPADRVQRPRAENDHRVADDPLPEDDHCVVNDSPNRRASQTHPSSRGLDNDVS